MSGSTAWADVFATQPALAGLAPPKQVLKRDLTLDEYAERWIEANPHVYQTLRRMALDLKARGHERYSMKALFEVVRWHLHMTADDPTVEVAFNNDLTSRLSRRLMQDEPRLAGFFCVRALRAA